MAQAIAPPVATSIDRPAARCRPPFRSVHTRASCISFATASGRERGPVLSPRAANQRPTTARPRSSRPLSSHRRLTSDTTTHWQFLTRPATASPAPPRPQSSSSSTRPRPATARDPPAIPSAPPLPRRPATSRPTKPAPTISIDPRVLHEAVRRETQQTEYTGPLLGQSVDVQPPPSLLSSQDTTHSDSLVTNAISRAEFHRVRAFHQRAKGEFASAIAHYEALLALRPSDTTALFQLAVAYEKTGRLQDALRTYTTLLPLDDGNAFAHYNVGTLLLRLGQLPRAIDAFSAAIQRSVHDPQAAFFRQRGAAFRQHGEFEKAAQDYARVHAVYKRRASLGSSSASGGSCHGRKTTGRKPTATYSAEPIYSPSRFGMAEATDHAPVTGSDALAIALKPPARREDDELWTLSDALAAQFGLCHSLAPAAQRELSRRVIAASQLPRGTLLVSEATEPEQQEREDGYVFFIARGRVDVYKAFRPHAASHSDAKPASDKETAVGSNAAISWEDLRLAVLEEEGEDERQQEWQAGFEAAVQPIGDVPAWTRSDPTRQQTLVTQLGAGDVCGCQGRFLRLPRSYSAVVAEASCDVFALRWRDLQEVERVHRLATSDQVTRFLTTLPLFHGVPSAELAQLAAHSAMSCHVTGSRVVCSPGQHVNGLLVVQHGALCQLQPSTLERPPTLAVSFALSGSVTGSEDGAGRSGSGRQFFTQLEGQDDPLLFVADSGATHGFLNPSFLSTALTHATHATRLTRGGFFCASSSWIPPRASRAATDGTGQGGVACAKSGVVSTESTTLLFFHARELTQRLSLASRALLHKNMQTLLARRAATPAAHEQLRSKEELVETPLRRLQFLKPPEGDDLVQQTARDADWQQYKRELVHAVVQDAARRKRPPATARF